VETSVVYVLKVRKIYHLKEET